MVQDFLDVEVPVPEKKVTPGPVYMLTSTDAKEVYIKKLPNGRIMVTTWVSRKGPQSYFVLDEAECEILLEVFKELRGDE